MSQHHRPTVKQIKHLFNWAEQQSVQHYCNSDFIEYKTVCGKARKELEKEKAML